MTTEQQKVKEWMQKFLQETPKKPTIPSLDIRRLRAKLILEETIELVNALGFTVNYDWNDINAASYDINLFEIADALADLHVVAYCGTGVACGIDMEPVMQEVLRSNDSKTWTSNEVNDEASKYPYSKFHKNPDFFIIETGELIFQEINIGNWIVKNKKGKVIKSPSYSSANIKSIIGQQQNKCLTCDGIGVVDSGGVTPWNSPIDIPCPDCSSKLLH